MKGGNLHEQYNYGINWKMSAKTILIQMHHKSESFEKLGKKLVLVIQQQFWEYISRQFQVAHLHETQLEDSIHFHIYTCIELDRKFRLALLLSYLPFGRWPQVVRIREVRI